MVRIGANPIGWSNDDMRELGGATPLETCLAEAREAGFAGMELGHKFPREPKALWTLPCCYAPEFAEDLFHIAELTELTPERVVALHSGATYRVYMYGFAPGFCYLGGVPDALKISRREKPRPPHPPNTVLLGGGLTLVSTFAMPTGWYLIGRTPEKMFAPERDPSDFGK